MTAKKLAVATAAKAVKVTTLKDGSIIVHLSQEPVAVRALNAHLADGSSGDWDRLAVGLVNAGLTPKGFVLNKTHYLTVDPLAGKKFQQFDVAIVPMNNENPFADDYREAVMAQGGDEGSDARDTDGDDDGLDDILTQMFGGDGF